MNARIIAVLAILAVLATGFIGLARADPPAIGFVGRWSKAVGCAEDDCVNFPIANPQTMNIGVLSGDAVLVMVFIYDCTANTNMGISVSDNGGNSYSPRETYTRANCGSVDVIVKSFRVLNASATTTL